MREIDSTRTDGDQSDADLEFYDKLQKLKTEQQQTP